MGSCRGDEADQFDFQYQNKIPLLTSGATAHLSPNDEIVRQGWRCATLGETRAPSLSFGLPRRQQTKYLWKNIAATARALYRVTVPVSFTILGSGSSGNCAYLETGETRLLIDAGFSGKQIRQRLATLSRSPESLNGILITHEHTDHIQGLVAIASKWRLPIYCNRLTSEAIENQLQTKFECRIFTTGASFEIGDVLVDTFSVPHDAYDPVGFLIRTCEGNIGFLTDLGHATRLVIERIRCAHVLVLETNHDMKLLQDDLRRPWSVKQRILSRHGHLSNDAAAEVAQQIVSQDLSRVYLGHLSRDCNRPELAFRVVSERLQKIGASHVSVESTSQDQPCPTFVLAGLTKTQSADAVGCIPPVPQRIVVSENPAIASA